MENHHVLIVDDVPTNIQLLANTLKPIGYKISFAQSGSKALEIIENNRPDLILLDVMMPEMDGFEVCQKVKEKPENQFIPIIFLTAKNDIDSMTKGFKAGGVDYITKPFNGEELLVRVSTHLKLLDAYKVIEQQNDELKELNATKDKFFSIIAHDLRNPFNALVVLTDILKDRIHALPIEEVAEMISLLNKSTRDGYELLENLLTWARSQRNKLEFHPEPTDIVDVANGNINLLKSISNSKHIELRMCIDQHYIVMADRNMLNTIFRNLITNAIKFSYENSIVDIDATTDGKMLVCIVRDYGVGIENETLQDLFQSESDITSLGTSKEKGTGLGLMLCKEFITKHNGRIWVESSVDLGSSFKFTLPLAQVE